MAILTVRRIAAWACRLIGAGVAAGSLLAGCNPPPDPPERWWRGNLHTHSLWSDGDEYPEVLLAAYRDRGYHFLAVSDHNTVADTERWITIGEDTLSQQILDRYVDAFGPDWVECRTEDGTQQVRLKRYDEYRSRVEVPGRFLVIRAEEITDRFDQKPLHVNATNLLDHIAPQGGASVRDVLQNNINAVLAQRDATGRRMFPHVNHPNFGWAVEVEDLMDLQGERFFEVYNGHPQVHNEGDESRPSVERMWDILLAHRVETNQPVMYGLAVDDAHHYQSSGPGRINPFRGWVMVRSSVLTVDSVIAALESGDFYGSTGVELRSINRWPSGLEIEIAPEPGVTYQTEFIGTRAGLSVSGSADARIGEVLAVVDGVTARYIFSGDELYVRARIRSSRIKDNPYRVGEIEQAWVQPVIVNRP